MSSRRLRFGRACVVAIAVAGCAQASPGAGGVDAGTGGGADGSVAVDGSVPADAPPAPIDAPAIVPDAPPACTPMTRDLLVNGNFDATPIGTGWVEAPADPELALITGIGSLVHTAPYRAWMGGLTSAVDTLHQDVVVPASTTSLVLTGYYQVRTGEFFNLPFDFVDVALTTTTGTVLQNVLSVSNTNSTTTWTPINLAFAQPHAGQTVRLWFQARNDSSSATSFYFDSLALTATYCE